MNVIETFLQQLTAGKLFQIVLLMVAAWLITRAMRWFLETLGQRSTRYRLQVTRVFPLLRLSIWTGVIFIVLFKLFALPENTFLAAIAALGIALGLAAQDHLRNLFAGVMMIFNKPFQVGDMVRIGDNYGEIIGIDLNLTRLRTFTDDVVTIPNAEVYKQAISNSNAGELVEMVAIDFHLAECDDLDAVFALARSAAISSPYTYLKMPVSIALEEKLSYRCWQRFTIKAYVVDVRLERQMATDIYRRVKKLLISHNITREPASN